MMVMHRSFAENRAKVHGCVFNWPPEWVMLVNNKPVTRDDLRAKRQREQAARMLSIRRLEPARRAAQVWVFHNPHFPYEGWHLYLRDIHSSVWLQDQRLPLARCVIERIPCGVNVALVGFESWKYAFWQQYKRGAGVDVHGRRSASVNGWMSGPGWVSWEPKKN